MKNTIVLICLLFSISGCFGQKKLSQVNLSSNLLEEIDPTSIPDIKAYHTEKFKQPKSKFKSDIKLRSNEYNRPYKLRGSDDIIMITSRLYEGAIENWDKDVKTAIEMFTPLYEGTDRYIEYIEGSGFRSAIFFTKDYKLGNTNYISYINKKIGIVLWITYISNSSDEVKIDNMRRIINNLRIE